MACVEHSHGHQRTGRLAHRAARDTELQGEISFRGELLARTGRAMSDESEYLFQGSGGGGFAYLVLISVKHSRSRSPESSDQFMFHVSTSMDTFW